MSMRFVVETVALRQVLQFSPVSIMPPMRHNHLHFNTICIRRTEEWSLRAFKPSSAVKDIGQQEAGKYFQTVSP